MSDPNSIEAEVFEVEVDDVVVAAVASAEASVRSFEVLEMGLSLPLAKVAAQLRAHEVIHSHTATADEIAAAHAVHATDGDVIKKALAAALAAGVDVDLLEEANRRDRVYWMAFALSSIGNGPVPAEMAH